MKDFALLMPEIFLALTFAGIVAGEIGYHGEKVRLITATALIGLASAFIQTLLTYQYGAAEIFRHSLAVDGLSLFFKLFFITLAALAIVTSIHTKEILEDKRAEYCALIVASALAMCLAASSSDLLLMFLSLQFMTILGHFLAAYGKKSVLSTEAAVKHLAFGVAAGAFFLYGLAILFAHTHTLNIYEAHRALMETPLPHQTGLVVFMLVFLSLCFQFFAFPMYFSAPDLLEGAATPVSAFLALGPRAAGFAVSLRFLLVVFAQPDAATGQWQVFGALEWTRIVALISGVTMTVGALLAFRQTGAKRMVAYLMVAESGFLLMGILVLDEVGLAALLYNLVIELFALMGVFFVLSFLFDELKSDRLSDLKGMLKRSAPETMALILFLASLVGLPPLAGFIGKFTLIGAAIRHHWYVLALIAIASLAVATATFARLAYSLVGDFQTSSAPPIIPDRMRRALILSLLAPVLLVGFFSDLLLGWAGQSLRFILW